MGNPETPAELLDPGRSRRSTIASLNPFSSSKTLSADPSSAAGSGSGAGSKSFLSRALSRKHKTPTPADGGNSYSYTPPSADAEQPAPQAPPPAYTESSNSTAPPALHHRYAHGAHPPPSVQTASTTEDPYAFLSTFDTVFLIDDSGSMAGRSWGETQRALAAIVPICVAHDTDGVDVYFLNHQTGDAGDAARGVAGTGVRGVRSLATVEALFAGVRPGGATPTGTRLYKILSPYLKHYARRVRETGDETCLKPLNIIVITDGAPSDDPDQIIVNFAKKLDDLDAPPYQVGIQFFQVGNEVRILCSFLGGPTVSPPSLSTLHRIPRANLTPFQ